MNDSLRFHSLVPSDLAAAISWYEEISPNLANRFRQAVGAAFEKIKAQPLIYGIAFDDVRLVRVSRFPYLVQFRMRGGTAHILGVFHSASDPEKWQKRTHGDAQ